jgi:hypothetical protein
MCALFNIEYMAIVSSFPLQICALSLHTVNAQALLVAISVTTPAQTGPIAQSDSLNSAPLLPCFTSGGRSAVQQPHVSCPAEDTRRKLTEAAGSLHFTVYLPGMSSGNTAATIEALSVI